MDKFPRHSGLQRKAANDNAPSRPRVMLSGITPELPIYESEVEIFDALLSNPAMPAANDNAPGERE